MVIDFHTHIFPEPIREKTISFLADKAHLTPYLNGSVDDLLKSEKEAGVDLSVVLPIATKPGQETTINRFAAEINKIEGIESFGGLHPFSENYREILHGIKSAGLRGIKLHPDYQGFFVDDEKVIRVLDCAAELGLIITFHAGLDLGFRGEVACTPVRARRMIRALGYEKIVLAHMGGFALAGDVLELLAGENVYFDMGFSVTKIPPERTLELVRAHGADRILFATDSPWCGQVEELESFNAMVFTAHERELMLYKNAVRLLKGE